MNVMVRSCPSAIRNRVLTVVSYGREEQYAYREVAH